LGDTTRLAERLLEETQVAVVPGQAFGTQEHIRISYATSLAHIEEGLKRMEAFFARF
jgi:aspartate aminotransferase